MHLVKKVHKIMLSAKQKILDSYVVQVKPETEMPAGRNCQAEINKIDAIVKTVTTGKIAQKDLHRLEAACLTLISRIREQRFS